MEESISVHQEKESGNVRQETENVSVLQEAENAGDQQVIENRTAENKERKTEGTQKEIATKIETKAQTGAQKMRARTQHERDERGPLCKPCTGCFRCSFRKKQIEKARERTLEKQA